MPTGDRTERGGLDRWYSQRRLPSLASSANSRPSALRTITRSPVTRGAERTSLDTRAPSRLSRTPIERDDLSVERSDRYEGAVGAYSAGKRAARIDPPRFPPVGRFKAGDGTVLGRGVDAVDRERGEQYGVSRLAYARLPQRAHRYARGQFRQFGHLRSGRARTSGEEHHAGEEEPPHQPSPSASSLRRSASRSGPAPVFSSAALYAARASERLFCVARMSPRCEA